MASSSTCARMKKQSEICTDIEDDVVEGGDGQSPWCFREEECVCMRKKLLHWYDRDHRKLPWRFHDQSLNVEIDGEVTCSSCGEVENALADEEGRQQQRAYAVWVSEVMLQQTRVATVVDYFIRWMRKWPTIHHLSKATQEDVNAMWAGLGYYRRARYLLEGARHIVEKQGVIPSSIQELKNVPGIGNYTAGAIASIAFKEPVPVVDGNVTRVLCRLQAISQNPKISSTIKLFWKLARQLVDPKRPGDSNQALMELGATICTTTSPSCSCCPISDHCKALALSQEGSAAGPSVTSFPMKIPRAIPRKEYVAVCVLEWSPGTADTICREGLTSQDSFFLLVKRPKHGLLAGLWEFPSVSLSGPNISRETQKESLDLYLKGLLGLKIDHPNFEIREREAVGSYVHIFTHIRMHMSIEWLLINEYDKQNLDTGDVVINWVQSDSLLEMGLSAGVKKAYQMVLDFKRAKNITFRSKAKRKRNIHDTKV